MSSPRLTTTAWWAVAIATVVTVVLVAVAIDLEVFTTTLVAAAGDPVGLGLVLVGYLAAFAVRALAWSRTLGPLSWTQALAAIHVATAANHVLPLRLGEALRVTSVARRTPVGLRAATASTVALRSADVVAVIGIGLVAGPGVARELLGAWWPLLLVVAGGGVAVATWWLTQLSPDHRGIHLPGPVALGLTVVSWLLETVVVWQVARWAGAPIAVSAAILVTAVAIASQVVAVAPGGFGTYEAAASAALVAVGLDPGTALAIALATHAVKTAYALVAGSIGIVTPAPSLLGRLRLAPRTAPTGTGSVSTGPVNPAATTSAPRPVAACTGVGQGQTGGPPIDHGASGPVVVFMPAHDEQELVGGVVTRVPDRVAGHDVTCLVIDDGSTDATAEVAARAGAHVVSLPHNMGLGAAVRRGLAEAVARDPAAVAFLDADGEYAPEELGRMVAPILADEADYVVGSRFAGDIEHMLGHRRFGNRVLTRIVAWITRVAVTDGQSGYRAFGPHAAADAHIVHDFNYAQVLTIDLLRKDHRYHEVPISYHFRRAGESFVRLGRYLRAVIPGIWHSLNDDLTPPPPAEAGTPRDSDRPALQRS